MATLSVHVCTTPVRGRAARPLRAQPHRFPRFTAVSRPAPLRSLQVKSYKSEGSASEDEGQLDFHALAKQVASKLASEMAGNEDTLNRLQSWIAGAGSFSEGEGGDTGAKPTGGEGLLARAARAAADQYLNSNKQDRGGGMPVEQEAQEGATEGRKGGEGTLDKLADLAGALGSTAGQVLGKASSTSGEQARSPSMLSRLAADYLGVDSLTVDSFRSWLSNPSQFDEHNDSKMVGALVHRLLQSFESHTGESFEGRDRQYDWLASYASKILGSSMTRSMVKKLVKAYLGLPI